VKDETLKVAVSTRIWDEYGECLGVLVANIPFGPKLVTVDMKLEAEGAKVISPMDWSYAPDNAPPRGHRPRYGVVLDRLYSYTDRVSHLKPVDPSLFPGLIAFEQNPRLPNAKGHFLGGVVRDYYRVGKTSLVVVLERPYPWPIRLVFDARLRMWAALVLVGLTLIFLFVISIHRMSRSTPFRRREELGAA
jgi:hypothetical protein